MQTLFFQTAGAGNYESPAENSNGGIGSALRSFGEQSSGLAPSASTGHMRNTQTHDNAHAESAGQAGTYGDEIWLNGIAYRALSNWRYNKPRPSSATLDTASGIFARTGVAARSDTEIIDRQLQLIKAMIAAARSDGLIDATERQRILEAINEMGVLPEHRAFFVELLDQAVSAEDLTPSTDDIEWRAQIYLASCLAINSCQSSELAYFDRLERVLELPDGLARKLQWHARRVNRFTQG